MGEFVESTMLPLATELLCIQSLLILGPLPDKFMIYKLVSNGLQAKTENGPPRHKQSQSVFARILGRL